MTRPYQLSAHLRAGVQFQRPEKLLEYHLEDSKASFSGFTKEYVTLTNVDNIHVTKHLDLNLDAICLAIIGPSGRKGLKRVSYLTVYGIIPYLVACDLHKIENQYPAIC